MPESNWPTSLRRAGAWVRKTGHSRAVTREGLEPSRHGGHGLLRTACLPFHHLAINEQWTVEGVEPSSAGCKPTVFPLDDTPNHRAVAPVGIEPTSSCLRDRRSAG